jgi:DeoD family purine-nucleoside phosphorylase
VIHLHPTAPLATRVLLPGDPGRALRLAQTLLEDVAMFNHNRGLWGYTGTAPDGEPVTVQSTGMGGPSAAIVIAELADLGASTLLRVGTCGALCNELALGDLVIAGEAIPDDGASRALGAAGPVCASPAILDALLSAAGGLLSAHRIVSTDLFYDEREGRQRRWLDHGAVAVEMETATLFALASRRGIAAGSLLLVSDVLAPDRIRIAADALRAGEQRLGELALSALLGQDAPSTPGPG